MFASFGLKSLLDHGVRVSAVPASIEQVDRKAPCPRIEAREHPAINRVPFVVGVWLACDEPFLETEADH